MPTNPIIPLGPTYADDRGAIHMILESQDFNSSSLIWSKPHTLRASHWHKQDSHYCFVLSGQIYYYERPVGSTEKPTLTVIPTGGLFYTAPMTEHEMWFPETTSFICLSTLSRKNADYEQDTTRLTKPLKEIYDGI